MAEQYDPPEDENILDMHIQTDPEKRSIQAVGDLITDGLDAAVVISTKPRGDMTHFQFAGNPRDLGIAASRGFKIGGFVAMDG